jgi:hypothetical protein
MKCLLLNNDKSGRCIPMSKINDILLEYVGIINGKEQWVISVSYAAENEWHEYYNDSQSATDRYNRLVESLICC